jgi:CspA family cold shock protein
VTETFEDETAPRLVKGRVKWFEPGRGYGFVTPDAGEDGAQGEGDVLFGASALKALGLAAAPEGASVTCEAVRRAKGLQAIRIIELDGTDAVPLRERRAHFAPGGPFEPASVKWFSRVKGYGFLTQGEGTDDVFVHMETVRAAGLPELLPGERVRVSCGEGPKGRMAVAIEADLGN